MNPTEQILRGASFRRPSPTDEVLAQLREWQQQRRANAAVIIPVSSLNVWRIGLNTALAHASLGRADLAIKAAMEVRDLIGRELQGGQS